MLGREKGTPHTLVIGAGNSTLPNNESLFDVSIRHCDGEEQEAHLSGPSKSPLLLFLKL